MKAAAAKYSEIRRKRSPLRLVALVVLIAFSLQAYITQTHIHGVSQGFDIDAVAKIVAANSPAHSKSPVDDSTGDCPFCQAVSHSGAFYVPVAPLLLLPFIWAETIAVALVTRTVASAPAHIWQSRAPPRI